MKIYSTIRATKERSKGYINNQLERFAEVYPKHLNYKDVVLVEFCKQDSRGSVSITLTTSTHRTCHQRHFANNGELMAFVEGFNDAQKEY